MSNYRPIYTTICSLLIFILILLLTINIFIESSIINYIALFVCLSLGGISTYIYFFQISPLLLKNQDLQMLTEKELPEIIEKKNQQIENLDKKYKQEKKYISMIISKLEELSTFVFFTNANGSIQGTPSPNFLKATTDFLSIPESFSAQDQNAKQHFQEWWQGTNQATFIGKVFCKQDALHKVNFITLLERLNTNENLAIFVDITEKTSLDAKLKEVVRKNECEMENLWEIISSNVEILQDFAKEIPLKIEDIEKEFTLLQEQSANRGLLNNLSIQIRQIKNHVSLLKLEEAIAKCNKIEAISNIVSTKSGEIRLEQLVEMEICVRELIQSLERYHGFSKKYLAQIEKNKKNTKLSFSSERLQNVENHFEVLQRMIFAGDIYRGELNEYLINTHRALSTIVELPILKAKIIFEATNVLQQIFAFYHHKIYKKNIIWHVVHSAPSVLLYGDCVKINKLLTLFVYMSIILAEKNSSLAIESQIIAATDAKDWDILELQTHVGIASKSPKTKVAIKKLFREYQKISGSCLAELDIKRKGFCFRIPGVINKKFGNRLQIAVFGNMVEEFNEKFSDCEKFFPFDFDIILNPSNCHSIDIAIADSKVIKTLGEHIHTQLQKGMHPIPLLIAIEKEEKDPITFPQKYFYLTLPMRTLEVRWLIFQCLDFIVSQAQIPQIGKTIIFQRPVLRTSKTHRKDRN